MTPVMGQSMYGGLWRRTLMNRANLGKPLFNTPNGEQADRSHVCGASVTHVEMPWQECEAVIQEFKIDMEKLKGDTMVAGV
eukprot:CAMPEP_0206620378 /NCGR_PEP_ID=MMETSP0325_2-20121206/61566_1 /ASSEMBLY_ACC=CAM_ASM_000347 /TAXON_ID=2866 /ORGANISM="Crypthecodinium cohnii, Strain Seligo" /LENGTH=80 /DNA_ID=CAMNT_0054143283 /DNA_START=92 /DNA_END=331 /DNA_ORIENTATION=-